MKKIRVNYMALRGIELSCCPICGEEPTITDNMEDVYLGRQKAVCDNCGISAPLGLWERVAAALEIVGRGECRESRRPEPVDDDCCAYPWPIDDGEPWGDYPDCYGPGPEDAI